MDVKLILEEDGSSSDVREDNAPVRVLKHLKSTKHPKHKPPSTNNTNNFTSSIKNSTRYCSQAVVSIYDWFFKAIDYEEKVDGTAGSILSYNTEYSITVGWIIPRKGSVFSLRESFVVIGFSVMIVMLLAYGSCEYRNVSTHCVALPDADTDYLTLMELCSIVIALFADTVLKRWWALRCHIDTLMVSGEQLIIVFAGILSSDVKDAHTDEAKAKIRKEKEILMKKLIGYLVLIFRLLFNNARGVDHYQDLVDRDIITQDEHDYFKSIQAQPLHVSAFMLNYIQEAARKGLLGQDHGVSQSNMIILQNNALSVRASAASVSMYIDVQMPFPFIQIISAVTYMFIIQLTLVCSSFVAQGLGDSAQDADIITGVLTIVLYNFVLLGLLRLFDVLYNPLGDDYSDFPGDSYMKEFEKSLRSVAKNAFVLIDHKGISAYVRNSMSNGSLNDLAALTKKI